MRVAVSSQGNDLAASVDARFGRAPRFILVDTETFSFEVIENTQALDRPQGAGIQAAQNIIAHDPGAVLTGNCGPKAFEVLKAAGIKVVLGVKGTIRDAVKAFTDGQYESAETANVEGHWA